MTPERAPQSSKLIIIKACDPCMWQKREPWNIWSNLGQSPNWPIYTLTVGLLWNSSSLCLTLVWGWEVCDLLWWHLSNFWGGVPNCRRQQPCMELKITTTKKGWVKRKLSYIKATDSLDSQHFFGCGSGFEPISSRNLISTHSESLWQT